MNSLELVQRKANATLQVLRASRFETFRGFRDKGNGYAI